MSGLKTGKPHKKHSFLPLKKNSYDEYQYHMSNAIMAFSGDWLLFFHSYCCSAARQPQRLVFPWSAHAQHTPVQNTRPPTYWGAASRITHSCHRRGGTVPFLCHVPNVRHSILLVPHPAPLFETHQHHTREPINNQFHVLRGHKHD